MNNKVLLCVLDGFGQGKDYEGNAITRADAPFFKKLFTDYPSTLLEASGEAVGIPAGTQGGSEVGHLTIGAGRIVMQALAHINACIADNSFFKNPELLKAVHHAKENDSALHIVGMISDQGVHADICHAFALLKLAKQEGLTKKVYVHGIADGRDVPPKCLEKYIKMLQVEMQSTGVGKLATLIGRYYAMDRDKNLERTQEAFDLYTKGTGRKADDPLIAVEGAYKDGLQSDYYLQPILLEPEGLMKKEDSVIFFNFRTDRAAQLTEMLIKELHPYFVACGEYTESAPVAFSAQKVSNNLGQVIEAAGLKQLRIAETEKYAHVTFFLNSQEKDPYKHEERIMIPSPKVKSYAEKPEMSAAEITDALLPKLEEDFAFIALNFANLDLVGHSGNYEATVKAVETIDRCLAKLIPAATEKGYTVLITGDHGNAEYMKYEDGSDCPSHTRNPVPLIATSGKFNTEKGGLKDLAPTILTLLNLPIPEEMTGQNLLSN